MIRCLMRLAAVIGPLAFVAACVSGCQGIIGANGAITGMTVPPGCKAQGSFSYPMPQGAIMFSCDETGAVAAKPTVHALAEMPAPAAPAAAHFTIDRAAR